MTRVIHTADTHIGYRQYNSPARREDFLAAFEQVVEDAVDADVDAVVHAGDVFHDRRPDLPDLLGTIAALRRLADAEIPFLAIVGNHEDKRGAQWLDLFEELSLATRLDRTGTVVGDVTFYGLDYVPRSRRDRLEYAFEPPETDYAALVAHGQFAPLAPAVHGNDWDLEAVLAESNVAFDAALLGDEHEAETAEIDGTWATYPGSTERTSASERDERGYNLVEFDGEVGISRRGLRTREFAFLDVELREDEGVERVRERVREHDLQDAVAIVTIDGDGREVMPAAVEEVAAERGALIARVTDRREVDAGSEELEVSFADPDEAVRERVRELGLSGAAREVDETVRTDDLADSNVREAVRDRVEELVDEDRSAFEAADAGAEADDADEGDETADDADEPQEADEVDEAAGSEESAVDPDDPDESAVDPDDPDDSATAPDDSEEAAADADSPGDSATDPDEPQEASDGSSDASESTTDAGDPGEPTAEGAGDEQASMEEYL